MGYRFGSNDIAKTGRLYSKFTGIGSDLRNCLLKNYYSDFDLKNCHPSILHYLCQGKKLEAPFLSKFINTVEHLKSLHPTFKKTFLSILNDATNNIRINSHFPKEARDFLEG